MKTLYFISTILLCMVIASVAQRIAGSGIIPFGISTKAGSAGILHKITVKKCMDAEASRKIQNPLNEKSLAYMVYPNPVYRQDEMVLNYNTDSSGILLIEILNIQGKRVRQIKFHVGSGNNSEPLRSANLLPGIYFLQVSLVTSQSSEKSISKPVKLIIL